MKKQYTNIKQLISDTMQAAERVDPIVLLAVSKKQAIEKIIMLYKLGQKDFGESYVQEAQDKIIALRGYPICWHFIGPIQSNKTKIISNLFDWVHSIDRLKIARRINDHRENDKPPINICLQVNINNEITKSGFSLTEVEHAVEQVLQLKRLKLCGLMAIPQRTDNTDIQRKSFAQLRNLLAQLNLKFSLQMKTLSMGMSNDMQAAIMEGATIVRVGTALLGERDN